MIGPVEWSVAQVRSPAPPLGDVAVLATLIRGLSRSVPVLVLAGVLASPLLASTEPSQSGEKSKRFSAPEVDVQLVGAAAVLVVGGLLVLTDRRRRRSA